MKTSPPPTPKNSSRKTSQKRTRQKQPKTSCNAVKVAKNRPPILLYRPRFTKTQTFCLSRAEKFTQVITSSEMWLSMVAGTTLAILLYCAGATASIVYALYNAPTFYKECQLVPHVASWFVFLGSEFVAETARSLFSQDPGFRKRWKFLFLSVRPSTYWWITASMVKVLWQLECFL